MRIALLHTRWSTAGGIERYISRLAVRLIDGGHEVHYFSRRPRDPAGLPPGLRHHAVPVLRWPESGKHLSFVALSGVLVRRQSQRSPFHAVHGFSSTIDQDIYTDGSGSAAEFAGALAGAARSRWARPWARFAPRRLLAAALEKRRYSSPRLRRVLAMSHGVRDGILRHHRLRSEQIDVVPPPVDLEEFHPRNRDRFRRAIREELATDGDRPVVLFAGSGFLRKGLDLLIEALGRLPRCRFLLWVAGRDRRWRSFQALARSRGVEARFLGFRPDLAPLYAAADAFALPSRFDAFGAVVLEAMASALPVVVSARAGASEVMAHGESGLVVRDISDTQELEGHLLALADPALRERLGGAARAAAEGLGWPEHLERVLAAYREAAAR